MKSLSVAAVGLLFAFSVCLLTNGSAAGEKKAAPGDPEEAKLKPVKPAPDGSLCLRASGARPVGPKIKYMPEWKAFGWWTDKDQAEWIVEVGEAGKYDVWLEWSVDDKHSGNPFVFEVGEARLNGKVGKSGSWETYVKAKIGQMELKAGSQPAVFKPGGEFKTALLDLREIRLVPAAKEK